MHATETLIANNLYTLQQAIDLLHALDDPAYTWTRPPYVGSSIGAHLRHVLEHYQSLLAGWEQGAVDYDARRRDREVETVRVHALDTLDRLVAALQGLPRSDRSLKVKQDCDPGDEAGALWSTSSLVRELQYLQAHTIHHFALIAVLVRLQDRDVPASFGVAPSTLKFRRHLYEKAGPTT